MKMEMNHYKLILLTALLLALCIAAVADFLKEQDKWNERKMNLDRP